MVIPPILGATLLKIKDLIEQPVSTTEISNAALAVGFISALTFGILACRWMINIVKKGSLVYFAYYCFAVSAITVAIQFI